jgi:hypothetical protein
MLVTTYVYIYIAEVCRFYVQFDVYLRDVYTHTTVYTTALYAHHNT